MKTLGRILAAALASMLALAAAVPAQIPTEGWVHLDDDQSLAPHVSLGDLGGQVFAHFPAPCCDPTGALLLVANDVGPAGPVAWSLNTQRDVPWDVDSAEADDVHVSIVTREPTPTGPYRVWVHRWSSASPYPTWSRLVGTWLPGSPSGWSAGRPRVGCSRDGSVVVALVDLPGTFGRHRAFVIDGATGAVRSSVEVPAPAQLAPELTAFDLSGDGTVAVWRLGRGGYVFDVARGQLLLTLDDGGSEFSGGSIAVSDDGNVVALVDNNPGKVRFYERAMPGAEYQLVHVHQGPAEAGSSTRVDVSADGSTVAVGYGGFNFPGNAIWVEALDVPSRALTMSDVTLFPNTAYGVADLAISDDGQRFVMGVIGGEDFDAHRILLYTPDQDEPLWTAVELLGGVRDVDISGDGRMIVFGGSSFDGFGAATWLLPVEASADFVVTGIPALGGGVGLALAGAPGSRAWLLLSPLPADPPLVLGSGLLHLDPLSLVLVPVGTLPATGTLQLTATVPLDALLIGVEIWTQGVTTPGDVLTESWRKLTVLP